MDEPGLLTQVVAVTRGADARDHGTVALAITYAAEIERGGDLSKLGPALLAALEALQLSPRARKEVKLDEKPGLAQLDDLAGIRARKSSA